MKVCVFGAGAIGGYLAHGLSGVEDVELSIIARGPHLAAIREKGLTLRRGDSETVARPAKASSDPREIGPVDVVINGLKAHQAWETAELLKPLLGPQTALVTCQNGVPWWYTYKHGGELDGVSLNSVDPGRRQWEAIGPERAIGCVVMPATEIVAPGVIKHIYGDKFELGEPDRTRSPRVEAIAKALTAGGFSAPVLDDIRSEIWLKLWGNLCFNPISALTRQTLDVCATEPPLRALARSMMVEAEQIANKLGVTFRVDVDRRINGAAKVGAHRTSMLQDLESGRALEIDALVTAVQELGRLVGVETPMIDAVLGLVQALGRSQKLYPTFPAGT
jgi:2-dehydropantoate 2-reductase